MPPGSTAVSSPTIRLTCSCRISWSVRRRWRKRYWTPSVPPSTEHDGLTPTPPGRPDAHRLHAVPARRAGGGIDPRDPRGRRRVRAARAAVLRRQGLDRHAGAGRKGVQPGQHPGPRHARGHRAQLPRGPRLPRQARGRAGGAADRGQRAGLDRRRPGRGGDRPLGEPEAAPDRDPARRDRGARLRRRVRRGPPGRGEGPGQGARVLLPRRLRPVGPEEPAARAVEPLQHPDQARRAHPGVPPVQLDRARRLGLHRAGEPRDPVDVQPPQVQYLRAGRHPAGRERVPDPGRERDAVHGHGPVPDRGRHDDHRRGAVHRGHRRRGDHRGRGDPDHRARCHPGRRPDQRGSHGRPQARGLLLMDILRFATAGSVDDGKSTLIGRLLYDSKAIFEDQLEAVERTSRDRGEETPNLALLTDGLRAEREQGITIDVAYRYFATPRRKFIIADTPGHIQYTRKMVTGASTADLAVVLVDARNGLTEQSRRHAFLATLLQVPHLVLAVNKMDLVNYDQAVFDEIAAEFTAFAAKLDISDLTFIPISALHGDNVVQRSSNMPWCDGPSLLHPLEHVHIASDRNLIDVRFPVQYVVRPHQATDPGLHDYRGYAGQVAGGVLKPGDEVLHLPSGFSTKVQRIESAGKPVDEAFPPMSVTLLLDDDVDISRGDMICRPNNRPAVTQDVEAMVCWMAGDRPLTPRSRLIVKHTTNTVKAIVRDLHYRIDVNTLHRDEEATQLSLNEVGRGTLGLAHPSSS